MRPTVTSTSTRASSTWAGTKPAKQIIARQKELGIIPADTVLTERADQIPAWDSLPAEERQLYARQMEVFAAQMEWVDLQIGRVVAELERIGELDNTLIFVTADNGASGEGGLAGTFNETYVLNGLQTPLEANLGQLEDWGRETTYPHYHAGWAMAGNTPFRYFKQTEHRGGQQDHLVVHWPNGIKAKGEIRNQYHHISDIAPTILEAAGVAVPETYHGVEQQPMDGVSMMYAFDDANAPNRKQRQYYEMFGNRAIWADGWKAVVLHGNRMPWELAMTCRSMTTSGSSTTLPKTSRSRVISPRKIPRSSQKWSRCSKRKPGSTTSIRCTTT